MFFLNGSEGIDSFFQSIHFELLKVVIYPILYFIINSPVIIFVFIALMFFSPILYLAIISKNLDEDKKYLYLSFSILYGLFPASLFAPSFELRPFVLLAPIFLLAILSFYFQRSNFERIFLFNLLFFVREEAIIFAISIIMVAFFLIKNKNERFKIVVLLILNWFAWLLLLIAYFYWTNYHFFFWVRFTQVHQKITAVMPFRTFIVAIAILLLLIMLLLFYLWRKRFFEIHLRSMTLIAYTFIFIPVFYQLSLEEPNLLTTSAWYFIKTLVFTSRYSMVYILLLGLVLLVFEPVSKRYKKELIIMFSVFICVLLSGHTLNSKGIIYRLENYNETIVVAEDVFKIKSEINRYEEKILTDHFTHQAFYDFNHVYMYSRFPSYIQAGPKGSFPNNSLILQKLIADEIDYIIISKNSRKTLDPFLRSAEVQTEIIFENKRYIALKIIR